MSYVALEEKLKLIPEEYFPQIDGFLDLIISLSGVHSSQAPGHPILGVAKGQFKYPDNINLYDEEIAEMFGIQEPNIISV